MMNFTASTAEQLRKFAAAGAPKAVDGACWTKMVGGVEVGEDGYIVGIATEAEKKLDDARKAAALEFYNSPASRNPTWTLYKKAAKIKKEVLAKVEAKKATKKPVAKKVAAVKVAAKPGPTTTQKRVAAMAWIAEMELTKGERSAAITLIATKYDVPRNYAANWLKAA